MPIRRLHLADQLPHGARLLCLGAHCDDIEIGAGGTVLRLVREVAGLDVTWVVFSSGAKREAEARAAATRMLAGAAGAEVCVESFRNGYFPYRGEAIKDYFEALKARVQPDLILTHHLQDRHQDHRLIGELTWNTFREHLILEYEIPKYDGDLGQPNAFVEVPPALREAKKQIVRECFQSQAGRHWFSDSTLDAVMRLRGVECRAADGYAEAFHARKLLL